MAENITVEQVLRKLDRISEEWVEKDLEKGIVLPFRHWRGGRYKELLFLVLWKSVIVPFVFTIVLFTCARIEEWKVFAILFPCYIVYWVICVLIRRRENANFILKLDGITIVTTRDKRYIPWDAVKGISSNEDEAMVEQVQTVSCGFKSICGNGYNLVIRTENKYYTFYEVYAKAEITDSNGQVSPAMMPLHVAYKVLNAAQRKVKSV